MLTRSSLWLMISTIALLIGAVKLLLAIELDD